MEEPRASRLIVGVGHVLRRDDGVGVRAAEALAALPLPADVEVCDAGLGGWELAAVLERRGLVVVIDAVDAGAEPGAIFRLAADDLRPCVRTGLTLHDFHLLDALDETRLLGTSPRRVVVLAVQPGDLSGGIGLSPAVEAALPRLLELAVREVGLSPEILRRGAEATAWSS